MSDGTLLVGRRDGKYGAKRLRSGETEDGRTDEGDAIGLGETGGRGVGILGVGTLRDVGTFGRVGIIGNGELGTVCDCP